MSEDSQDKTKRKYLQHLTSYEWSYQCSIFYVDPEDSIQLLNHAQAFKQRLRRKCPNQPFLIRVCLYHNRDKVTQAYLSIYTTNNCKQVLTSVANATFPVAVNVLGQRREPATIAGTAATIGREKPHNLNQFFNKTKINRYSILNEALLAQHRKPTAE